MKKLILLGVLLGFFLMTNGQEQRNKPGKTFSGFIKPEDGMRRGDAQLLFKKYFDLTTADEMRLSKVETDELGFIHEKFQQYYKGIKVDGATYTIHSKDGIIKTLSGSFREIKNLDIIPGLTETAAFNAATNKVNAKVYAWEDPVNKGYPGYKKPKGELVIFSDPDLRIETALAFKFDIYAADPLYRAWVYVDAKTGKVLAEYSRIHESNVPATANTLYNGTRSITADNYSGSNHRLRQTASGNGVETYSLNNGTNYSNATDITSNGSGFTGDPAANQAHWGAERTYDYYYTLHNRNSYNNTGGVLKSYVHYSNNYVNAFWDGSRMTYGDGNGSSYGPLVSLDICGHELTHGVTEYSANLVYSNQPGALNESFSDIFGEAIENYALGSNDWLMGNDIGIGGGGAFRSMSNPNQFGDPDTYQGTYWYTGSGDYGGVHTNSGVQNKWFYILSSGESGTNDINNAYQVTGIGLTKAAKIAYRNLAVYLFTNSTYADARVGAIQSAIDLYGPGSAEEIATTNAWYAVGVGGSYCVGCLNYCTAGGNNASYEWIKTVTIGSFTNNSGGAGYSDFTSQVINLAAGSSNSVNLVPGFSGTTYSEYWRIWIDLNADGDFTDAGEQLFNGGPSNSAVSGTLSIPLSATGTTRMRVMMKYSSAPTSPCEAFAYGEVEDYTVTFSGSGTDNDPPSAPNLSSTGKTTTTIDLSWTSSSDNVGVTGYEVYVGGTLKTTLTANTYTVPGLSPATAYSIYVRAKDAAGNGTNSNTISVTTESEGGAPVTIFAHYFESGWDGWADGGSDCERYKGSRSYQGSYSISIRDNSGTSSAMTSASYNVMPYNQLVVDFYFYAYSMESGKDFWLRYYNGSTWNTVATFVSGNHFSGNGFFHATVTINKNLVVFPANAQFRFQCDASSNSDLVYIDQVIVTGNSGSAAGEVLPGTQFCEPMTDPAGFVNETDPMYNSLGIFPNPATYTITVQANGTVKGIKFFSPNGAMIRRYGPVKNGERIDISTLQAGLYLLTFETNEGIFTKKLLKL